MNDQTDVRYMAEAMKSRGAATDVTAREMSWRMRRSKRSAKPVKNLKTGGWKAARCM